MLECEALDGTADSPRSSGSAARGWDAPARRGAREPAPARGAAVGRPPFERLEPTRAAARRIADRAPCARTAPARARELADRLVAERPQAAPAVCLHGDVHPKNVLVDDAGLALVDLDQVALGPAAADAGSMLAGLRYRRLIGELSRRGRGRASRRPCCDGYAAAGGRLDPADAALARRRGPARRARPARDHQGSPAGLERLSDLLAEADATLASAAEVAA